MESNITHRIITIAVVSLILCTILFSILSYTRKRTNLPDSISKENPTNVIVADETSLLKALNESGKSFFTKSMSIRAQYSESSPYKHFQRDRDGDGNIDVMDANGYLHLYPGGGYSPNPALYNNIPSEIPPSFYRYIKDCKTKVTIERQMIFTKNGYKNYIGDDRYEQQCLLDGSSDQFYVESNERLE